MGEKYVGVLLQALEDAIYPEDSGGVIIEYE
jgi:hypothetical protein